MINENTVKNRQKKGSQNGKVKERSIVFNVIAAVWLTLFTLALLIPFYVIIITSVTPNTEIMSTMNFIWWPKEFTGQAYVEAFTNPLSYTLKSHSLKILLGFGNTLWQTIPTALVAVCFRFVGLCVLQNEFLGQKRAVLYYAGNHADSGSLPERGGLSDVR